MTFRKMTRQLEALLAEGKAELFTLDPELSGEGGVTAVEHRHPTCQPPGTEPAWFLTETYKIMF